MIKLAVIFGGNSSEHNVSIVSGTSVISNLDKNKYKIYPIYIDRNGKYYKYTRPVEEITPLKINEELNELELIDNIFKYLENIDVVFPVLHGQYGEDGCIQGMLELVGKKYVGCKLLSSAICMDKVYAKVLFKVSGIEVAKSMYIQKNNKDYVYIDDSFNRMIFDDIGLSKEVEDYLKYPVFIKPSNQGSSVGVSKANNKDELIKYIEEAFKYDRKVLIEETIVGREVECAILGNDNLTSSYVGEILSAGEFYTYDSKYNNIESKTIIPADIDKNIIEKIRLLAIKAYKSCDCSGLARVDFFIEDKTNRIIINEINTMPGFTEISMYPKLMEHLGYNYSNLLDTLIELAK